MSETHISTPLNIRSASPDDGDLLAAFGATAFRDTYRDLDDPDEIEQYVAKSFTPEVVRSQIADPASIVLLAYSDSELVGYAHIRHSDVPLCVSGPSPIELVRLYLAKASIGKGYGAQLMRAVFGEARELNCRTIWLGVYDRNIRAVEFYQRFGFVQVGTKEFILGGRVYIDPVMAAPVPELA